MVEREFNARRRAIEEDARRKSKLDGHKAKIQAGAMAAGEQPIVAFGEPLWPPQRPDLTSPYTYKELSHACWFVGYFLGIARPGWKPTETAMAGRHLAKKITPTAKSNFRQSRSTSGIESCQERQNPHTRPTEGSDEHDQMDRRKAISAMMTTSGSMALTQAVTRPG